jgi:hypothetical protein
MSQNKDTLLFKWSFAALLMSQCCFLTGCDAPSESEDTDVIGDQFRGWTSYTSEENPPLTCSGGEAVIGANCLGSYCDNVALNCGSTGRTTGWTLWKPYISEETGGAFCSGNMWMTGIDCNGGYCDNISIQCSEIVGSNTGSCFWTSSYSEENGPFTLNPGWYVKGVDCDGSYCDNKSYYYCFLN